MLRCSGSSQNPGSSVLDELQLSNGLLWKAGEETITIIHPAGDKGMNKFLQVLTGNKPSRVTYVTLVPRGNETLRRDAMGNAISVVQL